MKSTEMKEKIIEQRFVEAVRNLGGQALKFVSPGLDGVPDRIVLLPGGKCFFAEMKAPGQKPRKLQGHRIAMLRRLGFRVEVIDDPAQIPKALERGAGEFFPEICEHIVTLQKPYRMPAPEMKGETSV